MVLEHPGVHRRRPAARLQAVPKVKQIGYYSDAYKLEFVLPKFNMFRKILAESWPRTRCGPGLVGRRALGVARLVLLRTPGGSSAGRRDRRLTGICGLPIQGPSRGCLTDLTRGGTTND